MIWWWSKMAIKQLNHQNTYFTWFNHQNFWSDPRASIKNVHLHVLICRSSSIGSHITHGMMVTITVSRVWHSRPSVSGIASRTLVSQCQYCCQKQTLLMQWLAHLWKGLPHNGDTAQFVCNFGSGKHASEAVKSVNALTMQVAPHFLRRSNKQGLVTKCLAGCEVVISISPQIK